MGPSSRVNSRVTRVVLFWANLEVSPVPHSASISPVVLGDWRDPASASKLDYESASSRMRLTGVVYDPYLTPFPPRPGDFKGQSGGSVV